MGNIDKSHTATVITTLTFSVVALAAIIFQHSSPRVSEVETPSVEAVFENTQESWEANDNDRRPSLGCFYYDNILIFFSLLPYDDAHQQYTMPRLFGNLSWSVE